MYKRISITLPEKLLKFMEKERKGLRLNRSELIKKSIENFFGLDSKIDQYLVKKYGPVYESLNKDRRMK